MFRYLGNVVRFLMPVIGLTAVGIQAQSGDMQLADFSTIPKVNFAAAIVLEYHQVATAPDRSLDNGVTVSTGHMQRVAAAYDPLRHLITFDDGYEAMHSLVLPIFNEAKVPAIVSIVNEATPGSGHPDASDFYLSRDQIADLAAAGWEIAFHAGTIAEHEYNYKRFAESLRDGTIENTSQSPTKINLDDPLALEYLEGVIFDQQGDDLLITLRNLRARVLDLQSRGVTASDAATEVLTAVFLQRRERLAELSGLPMDAIDTFVYPHSESNDIVRRASFDAGFLRAYAGGPIGDDSDSFQLKRKWMNDRTEIPQPPQAPQFFCPASSVPDLRLGYCIDQQNAYGPFSAAMTNDCDLYGGGLYCFDTQEFQVDDRTVEVVRWNRKYAQGLRENERCMLGTTLDEILVDICVEAAENSASGVKEAYGPFPVEVVARCLQYGGGDPCYSNRWSYDYLLSLSQ